MTFYGLSFLDSLILVWLSIGWLTALFVAGICVFLIIGAWQLGEENFDWHEFLLVTLTASIPLTLAVWALSNAGSWPWP